MHAVHLRNKKKYVLTLKAPSKICSRWHSIFFFYFPEKISLNISCESSAWQTIYMKCQEELFSLKSKKKKKITMLSTSVVIAILRINYAYF